MINEDNNPVKVFRVTNLPDGSKPSVLVGEYNVFEDALEFIEEEKSFFPSPEYDFIII